MTMHRLRPIPLLAFLTAMIVVLWGSPAAAQENEEVGPLVVVTGRAEVAVEENAETVIIFDGPAVVRGTVEEAVVAFNGDVMVEGQVGEDVVALNGRVTIASGAQVGGDVVSRRSAVVAPDATVAGEVRGSDVDVLRPWFAVVTRLAWWLAVTVSVLALGLLLALLAPRLIDATAPLARTAVGPVIGSGIGILLAGPILAVILMLTLVGIPLGLYVLAVVGVVSVLGYTTAAWVLGHQLLGGRRGHAAALLAGLAVLRLVALVPILAGLVWAVAAVIGTGALAVAAWRRARAVEPLPAEPTPARCEPHLAS